MGRINAKVHCLDRHADPLTVRDTQLLVGYAKYAEGIVLILSVPGVDRTVHMEIEVALAWAAVQKLRDECNAWLQCQPAAIQALMRLHESTAAQTR